MPRRTAVAIPGLSAHVGRVDPTISQSLAISAFGRQNESPIRPPGRHTRASSRATAAWSAAKTTPCAEETSSKLASS